MSCTPTPTETEFTTIFSTETSTSFSEQVTTLPDSLTTLFSTSCIVTASDGSCNSSTVSTEISTVAGSTTTLQIPVVITSTSTQIEATSTLFASCTNSSSNSGSSQQSSSSSQASSSSSSTSSHSNDTTSSSSSSSSSGGAAQNSTASSITSTVTSISTPPPTSFVTTTLTTLPDGDVTQLTLTITSTLPPSTVLKQTVVPAPTLSSGGAGDNSNHDSNVAAIVGGVVGGVVGLAVLLAFLFYLRRRRTRWNDIFDDNEDNQIVVRPMKNGKKKRFEIDAEEPKPYVYGLIGQAPQTSPSPPPMRDLSPHSRAHSLTPLVVNGAGDARSAGSSASHGYSTALCSPSPGALEHGGRIDRPPSLVLAHTAPSTPSYASVQGVSDSGSPIQPTHESSHPGVLRLVNDSALSRSSSVFSRRMSSNNLQSERQQMSQASSSGKSAPLYANPTVIVHKDGGSVPVEPPSYE